MMNRLKQQLDMAALHVAAKATAPVFFGYMAIGIAFGLLLNNAGYSWVIALLMSTLVYAGAAQFIAVGFFVSDASFLEIATVTFLVNFRHMVYGLSLFSQFNLTGRLKPYMIFSLTDETYALLTGLKEPQEVDRGRFYFYISLLNHCYWIAGSVIGAVAGSFMTINTTGLDFSLTALFIVLLFEQFTSYSTKIPFAIGGACALLSLVIIGKSNMLLAAIILSIGLLLIFKGRITQHESD
ncbi:AzlC family ABC transporter permease [Propionispora sp. 2/2-37]|uniref:AzlC family ABC transporter permease n=1 Tax=Propionispora sp. 2/2-37 TaxID=1677858 RepID=UPI001C11424D|nr:AzlC family ABC transporter permease [Propionispora sp. 2/2-37]